MTLPALSPATGGMCADESMLEPADILVTAGGNFSSRAIQVGTLAPVSHAMIYLGGGRVIEAIPGMVGERSLQEALQGATLAVGYRRTGITGSSATSVVAAARTIVATNPEYDYTGAAGVASPAVCLLVVPAGLGPILCGAASRGLLQSEKRFFCSELVLEAYRRGGVPLTTSSSATVSPGELAELSAVGTLSYVGHFR